MTKLLSLIVIGLLSLIINIDAYGQNAPTPGTVRPSFSSPNEIVLQLQSQRLDIRKQIAMLIGLTRPINNLPCYEFDHVESVPADLIKGISSRLLVIRSPACEAVFLVPVDEEDGKWITPGPIILWAKFSDPSYKLESLITAGEHEIVVSNLTVVEGTGVLQRNFMIFQVTLDAVRTVFDEPEFIHLSVPMESAQGGYAFEDNEKSIFTFRSGDGTDGLMRVDERRDITVGGKPVTVYRTYGWDRQLRKFGEYATGPSQ